MSAGAKPRRLVLIRHGQSRATVDAIVGGRTGCSGLTELGHVQAAALARRVARTGELEGATQLLSSTLPRAIETAQALCPVLDLEVTTDSGLCEMDPGEGDGLSWHELARRFGSFDISADPYRPMAPGGESWAAFGLRVGETLARLMRRDGLTVAVCHGGIVEQAMIQSMGMPASTGPGTRFAEVPNTSITEWAVEGSGDGVLRWRLVRFADAAHLHDHTG